MGRFSLKSHASEQKHKQNEKNVVKSVPLQSFFSCYQSQSECIAVAGPSNALPSALAVTSTSSTLDKPAIPSTYKLSSLRSNHANQPAPDAFQSKKGKWWEVTEAETLWYLETVICHNSLRNAKSSVRVFKTDVSR